VLDKRKVQKTILKQIKDFSEEDYVQLKPYIYEQDIASIQKSIASGTLTYKRLVQWYLYRINKFEFDPNKSLHTIIAINPDAVKEAEEKDIRRGNVQQLIYGMPILLKDNIDAEGMPTTAGAIVLEENMKDDAFIVKRLKSKGAIILGKVNLSEWAYFFCAGCPVGYSAIGGQTLNPYGRMIFETGGSSAGSGTSMAANYAVAAIGTETSGSILSPSSQNSVVGLKPTIGLLSRSGIVPISSTLDTPGPMTRNVMDNAILLSALVGKDEADPYTKISLDTKDYAKNLTKLSLEGLRIGANKKYMDDFPMYAQMMVELQKAGAEVFGFEPKEVRLRGFSSILNIDMKHDLPKYLSENPKSKVHNVAEVIAFNKLDMALRAPYGQERLDGILTDRTSADELKAIISEGQKAARSFFDEPIEEFDLDAITSINNYDASRAALAHYPALTLPMGYKETGEPVNLTLIAPGLSEEKLLQIAYAIEKQTRKRLPPEMMD
jgi:amidase